MTTTPSTSTSRPIGAPSRWPDTTHTEPPSHHNYASALWLLGRHPTLTVLLARVPDVLTPVHPNDPDEVDPDDPGAGLDVYVDLDALAAAVTDYDADTEAWAEYSRRRPAPDEDAAYTRWAAAGPPTSPTVRALRCMTRNSVTRLRLLAVFASTRHRTHLTAHDLTSLDQAGQALLTDWCTAIRGH